MPIISSSAVLEAPEPDTILIEDAALPCGFVQLPKAVLYVRHLSRDAKLLYAVLLGYAWQEQRCFPGYQRLYADLAASENAVWKWLRELEDAHLISQRRRGQGRTNLYLFHDLSTATIAVQEHHKIARVEPQEAQDNEEAVHIEKEQTVSHLGETYAHGDVKHLLTLFDQWKSQHEQTSRLDAFFIEALEISKDDQKVLWLVEDSAQL